MIDINDLSPGTKVKIIDEWGEYSNLIDVRGIMSEYLGKVVTVKKVLYDSDEFHIEEDNRKKTTGLDAEWFFYPGMVDYIVEDIADTIEPADENEVKFLIFGGALCG